jgi:hypothetical protein
MRPPFAPPPWGFASGDKFSLWVSMVICFFESEMIFRELFLRVAGLNFDCNRFEFRIGFMIVAHLEVEDFPL